jgi:hypothetical protein
MPDFNKSLRLLLDGLGIDDDIVAYLSALGLEVRQGQLTWDDFANTVWRQYILGFLCFHAMLFNVPV